MRIFVFLLIPFLIFSLENSRKIKVGQLFLVAVPSDCPRDFFSKSKAGNILLLPWATSFEEIKPLSKYFQEIIGQETAITPLIAVDQEGGRICRLSKKPALHACESEDDAFQLGASIGKELYEAGINFNLAPVVDVQVEGSFLFDRCISEDPKKIVTLASHFIAGLHLEGVFSCLKHYPGHGFAKSDSHKELPALLKLLSELYACDLIPFRELSMCTDAVMTAHILFPLVDKNPATCSKILLEGILRGEFGFEGVIVSDSLGMNGILGEVQSIEEAKVAVYKAAREAFLAGCDLLLLSKPEWTPFTMTSKDVIELYEYVIGQFLEDVEKGEISLERVESSFSRIQDVKNHFRYDSELKMKVLQ